MQLGERLLDRAHEVVQVRHDVPVGVEAPVQAACVAEQRDAEPEPREQRHQRIDLDHRRTQQVERYLRPGHVGDHQVERQAPVREPRTEREQGRGRPVGHAGQDLRTHRLLRGLEARRGGAHRGVATGGLGLADRQVGHPRRDLVAERAALVARAHAHRDHGAELDVGRIDASPLEEAPHRTRHGGEHDVVQRPAELVLDLLHLLEVHGQPVEAAVRPDLLIDGRLRGQADAREERLTERLDALGDAADEAQRIAQHPPPRPAAVRSRGR